MNNEKLLSILREKLTPERLEHSLFVAESAVALAQHYRADETNAHYAALAHDVCKCDGIDEMTRILEQSGYVFIDCERGNTTLLHAPAGAVFLRTSGLCTDEEILSAVRYHSTGRAGMTQLEKIVFIADLISADRDYPDVEIVRRLAFKDLDEAVKYVLRWIISDLRRKGEAVHPNSVLCLKALGLPPR